MRDYSGRRGDEPVPTLQRKRIAISLPDRKFFKGFEFTPEGKFLMGSSSRNILFWTREGRCIGRLELPEGKRIYQMRRFGDTLAVLGHDGRLTLWNCTQITQALQKRSKSSN